MYHLSKYVNKEQLTRALIDLVSHNMSMFEDLNDFVKHEPTFEQSENYDIWKEFYSLVSMLAAHADRVHDQQTRLSNALVNALASIRAQYPEADIDAEISFAVKQDQNAHVEIVPYVNRQRAGNFFVLIDDHDTEQDITRSIHDGMSLIMESFRTKYGLKQPAPDTCIEIDDIWHIWRDDLGTTLCGLQMQEVGEYLGHDDHIPTCMECLDIRREATKP